MSLTDPPRPRAALEFIDLHDAEASGVKRRCEDFASADWILRKWSDRAPGAGGYNKCPVVIRWTNGTELSWRYDLEHWSVRMPSLADSIRGAAAFYTGRSARWSGDEARYRGLVASPAGGRQATFYEDLLKQCDLGLQGALLFDAPGVLESRRAGTPAGSDGHPPVADPDRQDEQSAEADYQPEFPSM